MAQGKKPDSEAFISEPGKDQKSFYTKIGAAWRVGAEGISVKLKAIPLDGSLVLFPVRENT